MSKVLKVMVLGIAALMLILPAYAQEASKEQPTKEQLSTGQPAKEQLSKEQAPKEQPSLAAPKEQAPKEQPSLAAPKEQPSKAQASKELIKGLDEQVQEIKTDVLSIAAELHRLEEKLLYPSDTQLAIFVSVAEGEKFRLDAVDIELDGKPVAHHLYTYKELEALQKGGVQRIYVGNVRTGEHALQVTVDGKDGGSEFQKGESFKISKGIGPKLVGVVLAGNGIGSKTITVKDW